MKSSILALTMLVSPLDAAIAQAGAGDISALIQERKYDAAITALEKLHAAGGASSDTYLLLAKAYTETGAGIAAEAAIERARRLGADYALTAVPFAKTQLLQGKFAEALGALRGVNIPSDMMGDAAVILGDANFALKKYSEAHRNYLRAREVNPGGFQATLGLARLALQDGKLDVAQDYATEAERLAPDNTMVRYTEGMIARYLGDFEAAEKNFIEAQRLFPGNVMANIEMASIRIDQNRLEEAQQFLDAIYAVAPKHPMAQYLSGTILAAQGRYEEAVTLLNGTRMVTENYLPAIYIRGLVAYQLGQFAQAESLLSQVLQAKPSNMPARLALASGFLKQGKPQAALNVLQPALASFPDSPEVVAIAAAASMRLGDVERGEALYQKLSDLNKGSDSDVISGIAMKLALAKFVSGQREEALSSLVQVVSNNAADIRNLAILGEMQMREKDFGGAEETIRKLIEVAPDRGLGYNMKGALEYTQQDYAAALRSFSEAVSKNPEYYTALRNKSLVQIKLNDFSGAEEDLKHLLEIKPNDARAKAALGRVLLRQNKAGEAVGYFDDAVRAIPNSVDVWADYSEALAGAGKTSDAISQAKDTAVMASDRPDLLKRMGLLLLQLGQARLAVRPLSRYVAYFPDKGDAHLMQGRALLAMRLYTGAKISFERALGAQSERPDPNVLKWYIFAAEANAGRFDDALARQPELLSGKRPADVKPSVVGDLLLASGRPDEAVAAYRAAMAASEGSDLTIGLSRALDALGEEESAISALERFLEENPTNREARLALGERYFKSGKVKRAATQYEAILEAGVADAHVAALLAQAYMQTGNRQSVPLIERAYLIQPEDPFILDTYGWIMLQAKRDTSTAIEALERATRRAPSEALFRYHLAMAYLARGQRNDAAEAFDSALKLDPDFSEAEDAKRQLDLLR